MGRWVGCSCPCKPPCKPPWPTDTCAMRTTTTVVVVTEKAKENNHAHQEHTPSAIRRHCKHPGHLPVPRLRCVIGGLPTSARPSMPLPHRTFMIHLAHPCHAAPLPHPRPRLVVCPVRTSAPLAPPEVWHRRTTRSLILPVGHRSDAEEVAVLVPRCPSPPEVANVPHRHHP